MSNLQKSIKLNKQEIEDMMFRSSLNRQLNLAKVIRNQDSQLNVSSVVEEELEEVDYKVELDNNNGKLTVQEEENNDKG